MESRRGAAAAWQESPGPPDRPPPDPLLTADQEREGEGLREVLLRRERDQRPGQAGGPQGDDHPLR